MAITRGFQDSLYHDNHLINQWNSVVYKRDLVYILGDITMESPEHYYKLDYLNGRKKVILGNHDRPKDVPELLNYVETVSGMESYKGFFLTHCPIHPSEIGFCRGNIHAHIHWNTLHEVYVPSRYGELYNTAEPTLNKYYNVDALKVGFEPKSLEELIDNK